MSGAVDLPRVVWVSDLAAVSEEALLARLGAASSLPPALRSRLGVQLREPEMMGGPKAALGARLREATAVIGAKLVVNDRLDLAIALGADGVHLGRRSVSVRDARLLVPAAFLTRACHSIEDLVRAADDGADGGSLSPIFASPGKGAPLGLDALARARTTLEARGHGAFFLIALGGVDGENARAARDAGASGIAVVRADLNSTLAGLLAT